MSFDVPGEAGISFGILLNENHDADPHRLPTRQTAAVSSSESDSIFSEAEELTDLSDVEGPAQAAPSIRTKTQDKAPNMINFEIDEPEMKIPVSKRRTLGTAKARVVSEDEMEEAKPTQSGTGLPSKVQDSALPAMAAAAKVTRVLRSHVPRNERLADDGDSVPDPEVLQSRQYPTNPGLMLPPPGNGKKTTKLDTVPQTAKDSIAGTSMKISDSVLPTGHKDKRKSTESSDAAVNEKPAYDAKTTGHKRKTPEDSGLDGYDSGMAVPFPKKPRGKVQAKVTETGVPPQVVFKRPPAKRYGRKGRTSSPVPVDNDEVNFDEIPFVLSDRVDVAEKIETRQIRTVGMRGKNGQGAVRRKPVPKKAKVKREPDVVEALPKPEKGDGKSNNTVVALAREKSPGVEIIEVRSCCASSDAE